MAAAEILPVASGAANSADQTVTTTPLNAGLKGYGQDAIVQILLKDDAGGYNRYASLSGSAPTITLSAPGVYRFTRPAGSGACGVFSG